MACRYFVQKDLHEGARRFGGQCAPGNEEPVMLGANLRNSYLEGLDF